MRGHALYVVVYVCLGVETMRYVLAIFLMAGTTQALAQTDLSMPGDRYVSKPRPGVSVTVSPDCARLCRIARDGPQMTDDENRDYRLCVERNLCPPKKATGPIIIVPGDNR